MSHQPLWPTMPLQRKQRTPPPLPQQMEPQPMPLPLNPKCLPQSRPLKKPTPHPQGAQCPCRRTKRQTPDQPLLRSRENKTALPPALPRPPRPPPNTSRTSTRGTPTSTSTTTSRPPPRRRRHSPAPLHPRRRRRRRRLRRRTTSGRRRSGTSLPRRGGPAVSAPASYVRACVRHPPILAPFRARKPGRISRAHSPRDAGRGTRLRPRPLHVRRPRRACRYRCGRGAAVTAAASCSAATAAAGHRRPRVENDARRALVALVGEITICRRRGVLCLTSFGPRGRRSEEERYTTLHPVYGRCAKKARRRRRRRPSESHVRVACPSLSSEPPILVSYRLAARYAPPPPPPPPIFDLYYLYHLYRLQMDPAGFAEIVQEMK